MAINIKSLERRLKQPKQAVLKLTWTLMKFLSLQSLNYSWTKISEILGVSRCTLYRRLREAGIDTDDYTTHQVS